MSSISTGWIQISLVVILLAFPSLVNAQVIQQDRFEIRLNNLDAGFEIIPAETSGIFLYRRLIAPKSDQLEIYKLDTALSVNWHGYLPINRNYEIVGKKVDSNNLFLLLQHREQLKKDFLLLTINPRNGEYIMRSIRNFIPFIANEIRITSHAAIIGGYYNKVPVILHYSFITQSSKVLPGLFNEAGDLNQILIHPDENFDVIISARDYRGQKAIFIRNYDVHGNLKKTLPILPEEANHLLYAYTYKENEDTYVVAGTYGGRNSEFSKGVFIGEIHSDGTQNLAYYSFGEFGNFFKYMRKNHEQRIRNRIAIREAKGKKKNFSYRILINEILPYKDHYVMVAEAYYPRYLTSDVSFRSQAILAAPNFYRSGRIFDGYRYTHAFVIGFDKSGSHRWDNTLEINDVKRYTLDPLVKVDIKKDLVAMMYVHENDLRSKIINRNEVVESRKVEPLLTFTQDTSKPKRTSGSSLNYWYNDYLAASGVQEIVNWQSGERRVFFINKVSFRSQALN